MPKYLSLAFTLCAAVLFTMETGIAAPATTGTSTHGGSGTLVVLLASKTRAVIAADSRTIYTYDRPRSDETCKIAVLADGLVFFSTGRAWQSVQRGNEAALEFRSELEARDSYVRMEKSWASRNIFIGGKEPDYDREFVKSVAESWAIVAHDWFFTFSQMVKGEGKLEALFGDTRDGERLLEGVFLGKERNGTLVGVRREIYRDDSLTPPFRVVRSELVLTENMECFSFGQYEIAARGCGPKADATFKATIERRISAKPKRERERARLVALIELSQQLHPKRDTIGGPVDIVEISVNGPNKWHQRKPNCPAHQRKPAA